MVHPVEAREGAAHHAAKPMPEIIEILSDDDDDNEDAVVAATTPSPNTLAKLEPVLSDGIAPSRPAATTTTSNASVTTTTTKATSVPPVQTAAAATAAPPTNASLQTTATAEQQEQQSASQQSRIFDSATTSAKNNNKINNPQPASKKRARSPPPTNHDEESSELQPPSQSQGVAQYKRWRISHHDNENSIKEKDGVTATTLAASTTAYASAKSGQENNTDAATAAAAVTAATASSKKSDSNNDNATREAGVATVMHLDDSSHATTSSKQQTNISGTRSPPLQTDGDKKRPAEESSSTISKTSDILTVTKLTHDLFQSMGTDPINHDNSATPAPEAGIQSNDYTAIPVDAVFQGDAILDPVEMELVLLGEESKYAQNRITPDWEFVWEYATPAARICLRKVHTGTATTATTTTTTGNGVAADGASARQQQGGENNNNDNNIAARRMFQDDDHSELIALLPRRHDPLVRARVARVAKVYKENLHIGFRRPFMAPVIAKLRLWTLRGRDPIAENGRFPAANLQALSQRSNEYNEEEAEHGQSSRGSYPRPRQPGLASNRDTMLQQSSRVTMINASTGEVLKRFKSISSASRITGIKKDKIANALKRGNGRGLAEDYIWSTKSDVNEGYIHGFATGIWMMDPNTGDVIRRFPSIKDASRENGLDLLSIRHALLEPGGQAGGYAWATSTGVDEDNHHDDADDGDDDDDDDEDYENDDDFQGKDDDDIDYSELSPGHNAHPHARRVTMFDASSGKFLKIFSSLLAAERATGVSRKCISTALQREDGKSQAGGYIWSVSERKRDTLTPDTSRSIQKVDLNTNRVIQTYASLSKAAIACKLPMDEIKPVLEGKHSSAGGFAWRYNDTIEDDIQNDFGLKTNHTSIDDDGSCLAIKNSIHYSSHKPKHPARQSRRPSSGSMGMRIVMMDSITGKILKEFDSMNLAERFTGVGRHRIRDALERKNGRPEAGGYLWASSDNQAVSSHDDASSSRQVQKMDLTTNRVVKTYASLSQAAMFCKLPRGQIEPALEGRVPSAGGFGWRYAPVSTAATPAKSNALTTASTTQQNGAGQFVLGDMPVVCIQVGDSKVRVFSNLSEAAAATNLEPIVIRQAARNERTVGGFRWMQHNGMSVDRNAPGAANINAEAEMEEADVV